MAFTPTNPLCAVADVKTAMGISDTTDDDRIGHAVDAASRLIEANLGRRFWVDSGASTRWYACDTPFLVEVDDFADITDLVVKTYASGPADTEPQTWSSSDYQLEPLNQLVEGQTWPVTQIRAVGTRVFPVYGGTGYRLPYVQTTVAITTKWGFGYVPSAVERAAVAVAQWIFKGEDAPLGATAFGETGVMHMRSGLPPIAQMLLEPFSKDQAYVL